MYTPTNMQSGIRRLRFAADESGRNRREAGFSLIEILVVMIIITIMMSIVVVTFSKSRKTAEYKSAIAAANQYRDALEAFRSDHGNEFPKIGPTETEWPGNPAAPTKTDTTPIKTAHKRFLRGPRNELLEDNMSPADGKRPYMRRIPEPVQSGLIPFFTSNALMTNATAAAKVDAMITRPTAIIVYVENQPKAGQYAFQVMTLKGKGGAAEFDESLSCIISNAPASDFPESAFASKEC